MRVVFVAGCVGLVGTLAGCQPGTEIIKVDSLSAQERAAASAVPVYEGRPPREGYEQIAPIEAVSCRRTIYQQPATANDALNQLKVKAARLGADAVVQALCSRGDVDFANGCQSTVTCTGIAIRAAAAKAAPAGAVISAGTGFFINTAGDLVTNAHVVEGCHAVTVQQGRDSFPGTVVTADQRNDLALVRTERTPPAHVGFRATPPVLAEPVVAVGFPLPDVLAQQVHVTPGAVSSLAGIGDDTRMVQVTAPIQPGNSGGPLLDGAGNVIGVTTSSLKVDRLLKRTGTVPQNVNFAIKAATVATFLDAAGAPYQKTSAKTPLGGPEIASAALRFTVKIECQPERS